MLREYCKEVFGSDGPEEMKELLTCIEQSGLQIYHNEYGFATYKVAGDALLIYDVYVAPEYRGSPAALRGFVALHQLAKAYKSNVMITMMNKKIKNPIPGARIREKVGFKPYMETTGAVYYIRGV